MEEGIVMEPGASAGWLGSRWMIAPPAPAEYLRQLSHLHPLLAQVLYNRGVSIEESDAFLRADRRLTHDPYLLLGMREAVRRIRAALALGERIAVYGDFDVDGVTSTVVLVRALRALGGDPLYYIPHRVSEGYGLNPGALRRLHEQGVTLVVTVDSGSSSHEGVREAAALGMDVVITDHHLAPPELPAAVAVVNPRQAGCAYPFKALAGVGVAFKVAQALLEGQDAEGRGVLREVLDLVAIGSIADMAPLVGENRVLVTWGLRQLNTAMRVGVQALVVSSGLRRGALSAFDVGYRLAPRLNAAGRIDHASLGYDLLMTEDHAVADDLVRQLEEKNIERQRRTQEVLTEARQQARQALDQRVLVVGDSGWPGGVVGLVAGRLAEEFGRPAFVIEKADGVSRGSTRGVSGPVATFNVMEALEGCKDLLIQYGGHAFAAGFSIEATNIPAFTARLQQIAADSRLAEAEPGGALLSIDAEVHLADLTLDVQEQLEDLEPCGAGNPAPLLLCRHARLLDYRVVGSNHLRLTLGSPRQSVGAIAFGQAERAAELSRNQTLDVVFSLTVNEWNGERTVQLKVRDVRPSDSGGVSFGSGEAGTLVSARRA